MDDGRGARLAEPDPTAPLAAVGQTSARVRLEPDVRRQQILRYALQIFGERPYAEVSTQDLASAAGVTRGLIHHYFGTKRGLYLEVVRAIALIPEDDVVEAPSGPMRARVEAGVDWFLDIVARHPRTWVAATGAEGVAGDPEVERILAEADDRAARRVLQVLGRPADDPRERSLLRAYVQLGKGAAREWVRDGDLGRTQVRLLLVESLMAIVRDVLPVLDDAGAHRAAGEDEEKNP
ncbi:TetR/AcrR family transcriptional regulator [Luteipulveratus sp. YIM 133132]|uniref:TetR/AcrR family transcriptional regulator n=1 Tax=Luteipulveratus flavus TaxID=3031728 RepID=UPI0023B1AF28|nr:TetR/AcrR family transcriptional regulator [Luteipulveratus sp. YIM 133132]MDE9364135.1 TetR/AcrR family transcriptional regulator [Luteipulveratus sp. YIM 133132]